MSAGRIAGAGAALAFGAAVFLGCGSAGADAPDSPNTSDTSDTSEVRHAGSSVSARSVVRAHAAPARAARSRPDGPRPATAHRLPAAPIATPDPVTPTHPAPAGATSQAVRPKTGSVNLASYWPMFTTAEKRRFDYTAPDGSLPPSTSIFHYDPATKSMLYQEFNDTMEWQDTWYYRPAPGYGIAEWRDDYPQTNPILKALFGPTKKVVLAVPIGWGENLTVGGTYRNRPVLSLFCSTPPQFGIGSQTVQLEAVLDEFTTRDGTTHHDVARFLYQQRWGSGPQVGARYWMAKGVGPVAIQWVGVDPKTNRRIESVRLDAVVTSTV